MIDWGDTPVGNIASIYWPQLQADDVLALTSTLSGARLLFVADENTIQCTTVQGTTYIPIPFSQGGSLAGLSTIELPSSVRKVKSSM